jgi:N-methylhydantoinase A
LGILKVCHEAMAEAIRSVTIRRGIDPRGFALVALGGAGPVHAGRVAQALGIRRVIVPLRPGVLAAEGLLHAPIEEERHTTFFHPATSAAAPGLRATLEDLAAQARSNLAASGKDAAEYVRYTADMRYSGQSYELDVPVELSDADPVAEAVRRFHEAHRSAYGRAQESEPVEFVNLRAVAGCAAKAPAVGHAPPSLRDVPKPAYRLVSFSPDAAPAETPVFSRNSLPTDYHLAGPAIIEQSDTTTVVYPGQHCRVHASGALILTWEDAA